MKDSIKQIKNSMESVTNRSDHFEDTLLGIKVYNLEKKKQTIKKRC